MFNKILSEVTKRHWALHVLDIVCLIGGFITAVVLMIWSGDLAGALFVRPVEAMMFEGQEWMRFLNDLADFGWYDETGWSGYQTYLTVDLLFILFYAGILYYLNRVFKNHLADRHPSNKLSNLGRGLYWLYVTAAVILVASDLIETLTHLIDHTTWPMMTGIKFTMLIFVLLVLSVYFFGRVTSFAIILRQTLWSCRFSILGLLLTVLFLTIGQGKELMIYMIESWSMWAIVGFQMLVFFSGFVFWYMPRFFYPENPSTEYRWFHTVYHYDCWLNHLKGFEEDGGKSENLRPGTARAINEKLVTERRQISEYIETYSSELDMKRGDKKQMTEKWFIRFRKWTPIVISVLYFIVLILFYFDLFTDILGSIGNENSSVVVAAYRNYYWQILAQLLSLVLFSIVLVYTAKFEARVVKEKRNLVYQEFFHRSILSGLTTLPLIILSFLLFPGWWMSYSFGLAGILLIVLLYYFINVFFAYKGNRPDQKSYLLTGLIIVVLGAFIFSTAIDNNHFDLRQFPESQVVKEQFKMNDFVTRFKSQLPMDTVSGSEKTPVYFIAANGGGTTQAYWTASLLAHLNRKTKDRFKRHVFAMSGASGGAVGLGVSTLLWPMPSDSFSDVVNALYSRDFLSGGLIYLLTTDMWLSAVPINLSGIPNRNTWLYDMYDNALMPAGFSDEWNGPFVDVWREDKSRPIYVANTTRVEDGQRYFVAPVDVASIGGNLWTAVKDDGLRLKNLTFGQAVMLTNRFPLLNSSGKIDGVGHFVDGGYHDNSGIESLLEVYDEVKYDFDTADYEIIFIHINYGSGWNQYEPWKSCCPTCNSSRYSKNTNEMLVPLAGMSRCLLGSLVNNRVHKIKASGARLYQFYLPDLDQLMNPPRNCEELYRDEYQTLRENAKLKWVNNAIGRTISENHHDYVSSVLRLDSMPPGNQAGILAHELDRYYISLSQSD